ncbi:L,D-transpeptidase catalytic domain-containing protein [Sphingomonas antarctica]
MTAVKSMLNVQKRMHYGDFAWNVDGIPAGPVWIRVDLRLQALSVFRAGHEIGSAIILYGTDGKATPTGVFPILQRAAQHRSTLYDADMPFMLRLTNDGVAIHASNVRAGAATHGCIGIPPEFAKLLFEQVRRGDLVAIMPEQNT